MLLQELHTIGEFLVDETKKELLAKQKRASGQLVKSLNAKVNSFSGGVELAVFAESYFKFVDRGVNGARTARNNTPYSYKSKKPPLEPLLKWIQQKGGARGDRTLMQSAFALQTHIWKNGIEGINVLESILKRTADQYLDKISDIMVKEVSIKIDSILNVNFNK